MDRLPFGKMDGKRSGGPFAFRSLNGKRSGGPFAFRSVFSKCQKDSFGIYKCNAEKNGLKRLFKDSLKTLLAFRNATPKKKDSLKTLSNGHFANGHFANGPSTVCCSSLEKQTVHLTVCCSVFGEANGPHDRLPSIFPNSKLSTSRFSK